MKATRIQAALSVNPGFSLQAKKRAAKVGEPYTTPETITFPAGSINEHPDVWMLCVLPVPLCAPLDDECKAKVDAYLNNPARKAQLERYRQMAQPEVFETLSTGMKDFVRAVVPKYFPNLKLPGNDPASGKAKA